MTKKKKNTAPKEGLPNSINVLTETRNRKSEKKQMMDNMPQEELELLDRIEIGELIGREKTIFADEYVRALNKSQAYKIAKGSPTLSTSVASSKGCAWFNERFVQRYIELRMAEKDSERIATQESVLEFLTDTMNNNHEKLGYMRPVAMKDRVHAAELLGKRYALFTDKVQQDVSVTGFNVNILSLGDDEE